MILNQVSIHKTGSGIAAFLDDHNQTKIPRNMKFYNKVVQYASNKCINFEPDWTIFSSYKVCLFSIRVYYTKHMALQNLY